MASKTTSPDAPEREALRDTYRSPFGQELAPSELRADEPSFARFVGMISLGAVAVGTAVLMFNTRGPRLIGPIWGYFLVPFGLAGLLFHAARDADLQIRRTYGMLGGFLPIAVGIIASLVPIGGPVGRLFLPVGVPALLLGLFFLLPFARHEDDPFWRRAVFATLAGVGAALAAVGVIGGNVSTDFLLSYGLILALVALLYLWAAVGTLGTGTDQGYRLGLAVGGIGLLVFTVAVIRSALPPLMQALGWASTGARYFLPGGILLMAVGLFYLALAVGVCSDSRYVVLVRRELSAYFYSPIAYLVLFGLTVVGWLTYVQFSSHLIEGLETSRAIREPIVSYFIINILPVMSVMFVVPVLTMRLLSEEKRTGTLEVLLTAPVDEVTVVLSKFTAALIFFLFLWIPWGLFLVALRIEGGQPFDYRPLLSFGVVLVCTGAAMLSIGLFFSSLTRSQIGAAVLTFMSMVLLLLLYLIQEQIGAGSFWQTVFSQVGFVDLWLQSLRGKLYLRSVIVQVSITIFFLFLTVKALEARKWS
jgi:ABC-type transport system involved in multi-copper enzyme maturation permease subunit